MTPLAFQGKPAVSRCPKGLWSEPGTDINLWKREWLRTVRAGQRGNDVQHSLLAGEQMTGERRQPNVFYSSMQPK